MSGDRRIHRRRQRADRTIIRGRGRCERGGRCGIGRRDRRIEAAGKLRGSGDERLLIGGGTCRRRLIHLRHAGVERGVHPRDRRLERRGRRLQRCIERCLRLSGGTRKRRL